MYITSEVVSIKKVNNSRVINLTVDKNHTFVTENGIVTHNCDGLTKNAQSALRGVISDFTENCRFIITANYKNKIIDPLFSRCPIVDFSFTTQEKEEILLKFIKRIIHILKSENISFDKNEIVDICKKYFLDFRKLLNLLQLNSKDGELSFSSLGSSSSEKI